MSLLPFLLEDFSQRPSRIFDQNFGLGLDPEDLLRPSTILPEARMMMRLPFSYYRPWRSQAGEKDVGSTVTCDKDKFQVNLDVQHFKPEEITVKVTGENMVVIEGKHEEKEDEHGFISRHFVRKYFVPKGHDLQQIESKLSSDGVLTITAPKVRREAIEEHRNIPIQQTGIPSKAVENGPKEESKN